MGKIVKAKTDLIKTPQAFVHIRHSITLIQYKYWILMLRELSRQVAAGIAPDESGFRAIPMSVITAAFGYTPNKTQLWNDMLGLKNETISYNILGKDGAEAKYGAGFLSEWKVYSSCIEFKFPSFIEEVVRGMDEPRAIFQLLNWEIFNHFSGKYEAIVYKLCRDYRGVKKTPYMDIAKFREYMGLGPGEYKEFRDLNKFVISAPVKAINASEVSDIRVEAEFERQGRKVIGLRFLIEPKAQAVIPFPEWEDSPAFRFAKVSIETALQKKYLEMRSEEEVEICIQRANEYGAQQEKRGSTPNYGALYRAAISEGWHVQQIQRQEKDVKATEIRHSADRVALDQQQIQAVHDSEVAKRISEALEGFSALPEDTQDDIREQFRSTLTVVVLRKNFDKHGETSPMVKSLFAEFFLGLNPPEEKAPKKKAK